MQKVFFLMQSYCLLLCPQNNLLSIGSSQWDPILRAPKDISLGKGTLKLLFVLDSPLKWTTCLPGSIRFGNFTNLSSPVSLSLQTTVSTPLIITNVPLTLAMTSAAVTCPTTA